MDGCDNNGYKPVSYLELKKAISQLASKSIRVCRS